MRLTLGDSLEDMEGSDRKDWVLRWPGQIVIAGCQTFWTAGVENGIATNTLEEFFDILLLNVCVKQIYRLVVTCLFFF